jgi:hypothetical protein
MNVVWIAIGVSSVSLPPRGLSERQFRAAALINSAGDAQSEVLRLADS